MNSSSLLSPQASPEEEPLDRSLRPDSFSSYIGQSDAKESLRIAIAAAKHRNSTVDHVLLYGPPGLGKTSLAYLLSKEMGTSIRTTSGPVISKAGDLAAILTNLQEGDILFIDEIHRLQRTVEEILYPAMEDGCLDLMLGKGPSARSLRVDLPHFTLVGATTKAGSLSQPLRERFGLIHRLEYYEDEELAAILDRSSQLLKMNITQEALLHMASRSRKTPRVANRILRRVRDFALVKNHPTIGVDEVMLALKQLDIDELGLDKTDRLLLGIMNNHFNGRPVGLDTLAAATGEEAETIEDVIEPYLLRIGFIDRTPRGRVITDNAKLHLGFSL
ncbi:MAG: ruvB [Patescibacteria group bacterium]|jgi:Holliday junction DNA helicase RuvB|nr:ruvB [Patescibacteria group bacterium]